MGVTHGVAGEVNPAAADAQWDKEAEDTPWYKPGSMKKGPTLGIVSQKRAIDAAGVSATSIYYHVQNRVLINTGFVPMISAHNFDKMEKEFLGKSLSNDQ
jgi:hypothetical protein